MSDFGGRAGGGGGGLAAGGMARGGAMAGGAAGCSGMMMVPLLYNVQVLIIILAGLNPQCEKNDDVSDSVKMSSAFVLITILCV